MIREVNVSQLTDVVERLCIEASEHLPADVKCAIETLPCLRGWGDRPGGTGQYH